MNETHLDARAARDGCDCPPQITRCCHFDGHLLAIAEGALCGAGAGHPRGWQPFDVAILSDPVNWRLCLCGCGTLVNVTGNHQAQVDFGTFYDRASAEAVFAEAEQRLLAGELP